MRVVQLTRHFFALNYQLTHMQLLGIKSWSHHDMHIDAYSKFNKKLHLIDQLIIY